MNHQSNQLVAMRWLIVSLDAVFDDLHRQACDTKVGLVEQIACFHSTHRTISGVLYMARLPQFALLSRMISDIAADMDDVAVLYFASRLLHHELQQFIKTGLLRQELVIERVGYLLERYLPYDYLHTQSLVPYEDIELSGVTTWHHSIQIDDSKLDDAPHTDNLAGAWIDALQKLKETLTHPTSDADDEHRPAALTHLQTLIELARQTTAQKSNYQQTLWYLIILWLEDVARVAKNSGVVAFDAFDLLLLDKVLHGDFDNKSLASDVYVILSVQAEHGTVSKELLNQLSITAVRQPFFMQVLQSLSHIKSAHQAKRLPIAMLNKLSQKLTNRGWLDYAQTVMTLSDNYSVLHDDFHDKVNVVYDDVAGLYSSLTDTSLMLKAQTALNDIKSAFGVYLHSKDVADLPADDSFYQLHDGMTQIGLVPAVQCVDELSAIFERLAELKLNRIGWQLAHATADALVFFEEFFEGLYDEQYVGTALDSSMRHAQLAHQLAGSQDAQAVEIYDIYEMLLKTHETATLYDDTGQHQVAEGELIIAQSHHSSDVYDAEEVLVHDEIINDEPADSPEPRPDFSIENDPAFMDEQGHQVRLTDILEVPALTLSTTDDVQTGLQASTINTYEQMLQSGESSLDELGASLQPKGAASLVAYQSMMEQHDAEFGAQDVHDEMVMSKDDVDASDDDSPRDQISDPDASSDAPVDDNSQEDDTLMNTADKMNDEMLSERYVTVRDGMMADDFSHDDELREIFIEEADEVLAEIATHLPRWQQDIHNKTLIKNLCRNFHTLKGSGRMVGAHQVGDTAWAIENLLNRAHEGSVSVSAQMCELVTHTAEMIPSMVADFTDRQPPRADGAAIILQAENLLAGDDMHRDVPKPDLLASAQSVALSQTDELISEDKSHQSITADDIAADVIHQTDRYDDVKDDVMGDVSQSVGDDADADHDEASAESDGISEVSAQGEYANVAQSNTADELPTDDMADVVAVGDETDLYDDEIESDVAQIHLMTEPFGGADDGALEAPEPTSEATDGDSVADEEQADDTLSPDELSVTDAQADAADEPSEMGEMVGADETLDDAHDDGFDPVESDDEMAQPEQGTELVDAHHRAAPSGSVSADVASDELSDEILAFDDVAHTAKAPSDDTYVADYSLADELMEEVLIDDGVVDATHGEKALDDDAEALIDDDMLISDEMADDEIDGVGADDGDAVQAVDMAAQADIDWHSEVILPSLVLPEVLSPFMEATQQPLTAVVQDVDDDIREIYIEEAGEVLAEIKPLFDDYKDNQDRALLIDIRRGFHTLKGSGRMVGAMELAELAWSIENMLNRVLDDTVPMNAGMMVLIADVLGEFDGLVARFEARDTYPDKLLLWRACGDAYSKGHADSFDYAAISQSGNTHHDTADTQAQITAEPMSDEGVLDNPQSLEALNFIQEAGSIISSATLDAPQGEEEEMICGIFVEEARELIDEVRDFLAKNAQKDSVPVSDKVVRAFHTLRGALGIKPLAAIGKVGEVVERGLQSLQQHDAPMTPTHLTALSEAVGHIEAHLDAYENPDKRTTTDEMVLTGFDDGGDDDSASVHLLIDGLDGLLDAEFELPEIIEAPTDDIVAYVAGQLTQIDILASRTCDIPKFPAVLDALRQAYTLILHEPEVLADDELVQTLLRTHDELVRLFDSLAGSMSLSVDTQVLSEMAGFAAKYQTLSVTPSADEVDTPAATPEKAMAFTRSTDDMENINHLLIINQMAEETDDDEPVRLEMVETEDELLQIFLAEAQHIDELMQADMKLWHEDMTAKAPISSLQRHLHTIKGGAKLAGITSVSDLTHATESVYQAMLSDEISVHEDWLATMQKAQDTISLQLARIAEDKSSVHADGMIEDLQDFVAVGDVMGEIRMPKMPKKAAAPELVTDEQDTPEPSRAQDAEHAAQTMATARPTLPYKDYIAQSWHGSTPDKDILDVFLEEAKDLAESSSEDFGVFRNNTGDVEVLQSLQRKLHTIKGGARMVSANGMADLAHEMETVYENLGESRSSATKQVTDLLFACHDWISASVSLLYQQYNPPRPTPLIEALQAYIHDPDSLTDVPSVSLADIHDTLMAYENMSDDESGRETTKMPPMKGSFGETTEKSVSGEMIRISAPMIERMINLSGEAAINRARIDMNMTSLGGSIEEMGVTVQRLADQLRRMDIELEAQILSQIDDADMLVAGFDPLEMDQYSSLNQLSKSLSESASDLLDIKATLVEKTRDSENLLLQLSRTQTELQDSLMSSRMVPFSRITPRLQRIVRQTAGELGKNVELSVVNADDEMDRSILERITSPLEHMLRNAVDHGIEYPDRRSEMGKSAIGHITLEIMREGGEVVIMLSDDGSGINVDAVRKKAMSQGLIQPDDVLSDSDIMQYIFNSGLSTTNKITQISGRGVGMDVVRTEIRELGGSVLVQSQAGRGSRFIIRLPLTVAVSDALIVRVADQQYAIPLVQIERVVQVDATNLLRYHQSGATSLQILGRGYRLRYLNEILTGSYFSEIVAGASLPVIIIKSQVGQALALQVDEIIGSRTEVVVKPLGRQLSHLSGISAATIMGDGSVMLILDLLALMRTPQIRSAKEFKAVQVVERKLIMVVDDSVTVRKVTSRFLERQGFDVVVAKDGVDALEMLQETLPDIMLLDIEMPRMDGFEVATQVRNSARLKDLPIIMITSRTGEKHRERAFDIGVNDYMGKPFQENELLEHIWLLLKAANATA